MTQEEIQLVKQTGICDEQPLAWQYYETDGAGYVKAICQVCFTKFTKATVSVDLDAIQ